jgi:hypothetical protein
MRLFFFLAVLPALALAGYTLYKKKYRYIA